MSSPAGRFPAPLVARAVLTTVLCGFFVVALLRISYDIEGIGNVLVAAGMLVVLLGLQVGYFCRPLPYGRWRYAVLATEAVLIYVPLVFYGEPWIGLPGFLIGSMLLALPVRVAVPAAVAVVGSVAFAQAVFTGAPVDVIYSTTSAVITAMVTWGLTRLAHVVGELHEAHIDLARLEVARERLRIAQDLHDTLGSTLTAVTLRTELVRGRMRAGPVDPATVDAELADIAHLSRQALTQVRTVSSGPLRSTVADEIRHAGALLEAAGVRASLNADLDALPIAAEPTIAAVLRECVVNVLRHGGGHTCDVVLRRVGDDVVLTVLNDEVGEDGEDTRATVGSGDGLDNMRARVEQLGGVLRAGPVGDGTWAVQATIPSGCSVCPRTAARRSHGTRSAAS